MKSSSASWVSSDLMLLSALILAICFCGSAQLAMASSPDSLRADSLRVVDRLLSDKVSRPRNLSLKVDTVVLHFISNVVESPQNPYQVDDVLDIFETYGVSAHYLVDRNGSIYRLVSENRVAYHGGKGSHELYPDRPDRINGYSIGIEILAIGSESDMAGLLSREGYAKIDESLIGYTEDQYASLRRLLDDLVTRYPGLKRDRQHIIGHDEYAPDRKNDPGELFVWKELNL